MEKVTYTIVKAKSETDTTTPAVDTSLDGSIAKRINIKLKVKNLTGTFNITDIMLQTGDKSSIWNSHPSEVRWTFNE